MRRSDAVVEGLTDLGLIRKDFESSTLFVHRLVQSEFKYTLNQNQLQDYFSDAADLLFSAFPQQVMGRSMHNEWDTCAIYLQHVLKLARHFVEDKTNGENEDQGNLKPTKSFCKLLCSCAWLVS